MILLSGESSFSNNQANFQLSWLVLLQIPDIKKIEWLLLLLLLMAYKLVLPLRMALYKWTRLTLK